MRKALMALSNKLATKIAVPIVMAVAGVLTFSMSVSAAATLSIDPAATLGLGGSVTLTGTASCTSDYTGVIALTLNQPNGPNGNSSIGYGSAMVACDGQAHSWSGTVPTGEFGPYHTGSAFATAQILRFDGTGSQLQYQSVTIQ